MDAIYAIKAGNWTDPTVWDLGRLPAADDNVNLYGYAVTLDTNNAVALTLTSSLTNGTLLLTNGSAITAETITQSAASNTSIITESTQTINATINANLNIETGATIDAYICSVSTGYTVTINGNVTGGGQTNRTYNQYDACITFYATGSLVINGNVTGGNQPYTHGIYLQETAGYGSLTINGDIAGGSANSAHGISCANNNNTCVINGNVTGGSVQYATGMNFSNIVTGIGALTINGDVTSNLEINTWGIYINGGTFTINGNILPRTPPGDMVTAVHVATTAVLILNGLVKGKINQNVLTGSRPTITMGSAGTCVIASGGIHYAQYTNNRNYIPISGQNIFIELGESDGSNFEFGFWDANGILRIFKLIPALPTNNATLTGNARFTDQTVATLVRATRRDTGAWTGDTIPDPTTGAFMITCPNTPHDVTIFREHYRPLTHGPVEPIPNP